MPVGQFKTRANPDTGKLEKIPPEEQAALIEAAEEQEARDKLFNATAEGGEEAEPEPEPPPEPQQRDEYTLGQVASERARRQPRGPAGPTCY